ncbi:hypothetical protein B0J11DRAFT_59184 [Dendryphion nanum]|uniref:Nucleoside phosphorylase domain-containing protein n=1 Tax=Dendryphion nanum TaxID=256645 RepID=A0A9P9DKZ8_9PLEO|nr:hypothetical protein B0J11DRAFT_59184 [Dendryphion nanum]
MAKRKTRDDDDLPSRTVEWNEVNKTPPQNVEIAMQSMRSCSAVERQHRNGRNGPKRLAKVRPETITVAIFCALPEESVAIKYSLDERYECDFISLGPKQYIYSFGRIGAHNIIIARPTQVGLVSAALCAATVNQQFSNVRFALMVGIGAGIPCFPRRDIRLGDVAVSVPQNDHPGVLQYDFGKFEQDDKFVPKGVLNKPPIVLINADSSLLEDEMMDESPLQDILGDITTQRGYARPKSGDILFDFTFRHMNKGEDCSTCETSSSMFVSRPDREKNCGPVVHRGLILSGNGVVKNPEDRDRLQRGRKEAICFEMEAAGIMDEIPCLVIRGICDYADTHKQDGWHNYAAAVAAAYCKAILLKIDGQDVEETSTMRKTMQKLQKTISQMDSRISYLKNDANEAREATKQRAILNWLTPVDYTLRQNDNIKRREVGTGQWLLDSDEFQDWLEKDNQTLFCPGIPGAGKTILTSTVVNDLTARFQGDSNVCVAYFYYDFRRQEEQTAEDLLASLLRQLCQGKPSLPDSMRALHNQHEEKRTRPRLDEISRVLHTVANTYSRVFIIIDALDECQESNCCLTRIFDLQAKCRLNLFATSRDVPNITKYFVGHISLKISARNEDVKKYITSCMSRLPSFVIDHLELQTKIKTSISKSVRGMFLLAKLHMDSLINQPTPGDIKQALQNLPQGYNETYQEAMKRIEAQGGRCAELAKGILCWVSHAKRELLIGELQHALAVMPTHRSLNKDFIPTTETIGSICAGLVTIDVQSDLVRLVHHTAQEYFEETRFIWFSNPQDKIARTCVTYLSFDAFEGGLCHTDEDFKQRLQEYPFYDYAARYWGHHGRGVSENIVESFLTLLDSEGKVSASSQVIMPDGDDYCFLDCRFHTPQMTGVHLAAYFGIETLLLRLIDNGHDLSAKESHGWTPLWLAAKEGYLDITRTLLDKGAEADPQDWEKRTPLWLAAKRNHEEVTRLLLENGANPNARPMGIFDDGQTPIWFAVKNGHTRMVKLLQEYGADINLQDIHGQTPLWLAVETGDLELFKLLSNDGTNLNIKDRHEDTMLLLATKNGDEELVNLLLESGADPNLKNFHACTSLWLATQTGDDRLVRLLLEKGASPHLADSHGRTPLLLAIERRDRKIVTLLLEHRADPTIKDSQGRTPMWSAVDQGDEIIVRLLLEQSPDLVWNLEEAHKKRLLTLAISKKYKEIVRLLLENGANTTIEDLRGPMLLRPWPSDMVTIASDVVFLLEIGISLRLEENDSEKVTKPLDRQRMHVTITKEMVISIVKFCNKGLVFSLFECFQITEKLVILITTHFDDQTITLFLDRLDRRGEHIQITKMVVRAVTKVFFRGNKKMVLLLNRRGEGVKVTEEAAVEIIHACDSQVVTLLLNKQRTEFPITEEIVMAVYQHFGKTMVAQLLDQRRNEVKITEPLLQAAAGSWNAMEIVILFFNQRGDEVKVTEKVLQAAAGNSHIYAEGILGFLLDRKGDEVQITEQVLVAAATNDQFGEELVKLLLERSGDVSIITEQVLVAAATNLCCGKDMIKCFLDRSGKEVVITEQVIEAAAMNFCGGKDIIELLLNHLGDESCITEEWEQLTLLSRQGF